MGVTCASFSNVLLRTSEDSTACIKYNNLIGTITLKGKYDIGFIE